MTDAHYYAYEARLRAFSLSGFSRADGGGEFQQLGRGLADGA